MKASDFSTEHQAIIQQLWNAEDAANGNYTVAVRQKATQTAQQLLRLIAKVDFTGDPKLAGKIQKDIGYAYFCAAAGEDPPQLAIARDAFLKAVDFAERAKDVTTEAKAHVVLGMINRTLAVPNMQDTDTMAANLKNPGTSQQLELALNHHQIAVELFQAGLPETQLALNSAKKNLAQMQQLMIMIKQLSGVNDDIEEMKAQIETMEEQEEQQPTAVEYQQKMAQASESGMDMTELFEMLNKQFKIEIDEGNVSTERQMMLKSLMDELGGIVNDKPDDLSEMLTRSSKLHALQNRLIDARQDPSLRADTPIVNSNSYVAKLLTNYNKIQRYLDQEVAQSNHGKHTYDALQNLVLRGVEARTAIIAAADDIAAHQIEVEIVRRLAMDVRHFALRDHLTIAKPVWASLATSENPNAIFYSGSDDVRNLLQHAFDEDTMGLNILPQTGQGNPAEFRWNQLRSATLCIFDFSGYERPPEDDEFRLQKLGLFATVAYELGMAFALGRSVLVIGYKDKELPFDIDITPVLLEDDGNDNERLCFGINTALYGIQRGGGDSSIDETLRNAQVQYSDHDNSYVRIAIQQITEQKESDALKTHDMLKAGLGLIGGEAPLLITPAWPGNYPELHKPRCFHITAFGPEWADQMRHFVARCCQNAQVPMEYIRGDTMLDPDIIRSIWDEICQASHIVVDLTGLNVNVMMELAMAHVLGRKIIIITQDSKLSSYPIHLKKMRFHYYNLDSGIDTLIDTIDKFFA